MLAEHTGSPRRRPGPIMRSFQLTMDSGPRRNDIVPEADTAQRHFLRLHPLHAPALTQPVHLAPEPS
jgi:hypothetical protein